LEVLLELLYELELEVELVSVVLVVELFFQDGVVLFGGSGFGVSCLTSSAFFFQDGVGFGAGVSDIFSSAGFAAFFSSADFFQDGFGCSSTTFGFSSSTLVVAGLFQDGVDFFQDGSSLVVAVVDVLEVLLVEEYGLVDATVEDVEDELNEEVVAAGVEVLDDEPYDELQDDEAVVVAAAVADEVVLLLYEDE
jgi:hypothetical protein